MTLVTYPNDRIGFICGPQLQSGSSLNPFPAFDQIAVAKGKELATSVPTEAQDFNAYLRANYYDLALCQYINFYRTGDAAFLTIARKTADDFWASRWIAHGTVVQGENNLSPREMAYAGLMLRALDGRPEMWDYLERQTRAALNAWLLAKIDHPGPKLPLWMDMRELGYVQLYATLLAKVLPDTYPLYANGTQQASTGIATDGAAKRAQYLSDVENLAVNFFGRLQQADGSWRNDVPSENVINAEQPMMTGIYHEAIGKLHESTTNETVKASLKSQLTRSLDHLFPAAYDQSTVTNFPEYFWRFIRYYYGGGTADAPTKFDSPQPSGAADGLQEGGDYSIASRRHLNATLIHPFGFGYKITGDVKYSNWGDELMGACFGDAKDEIKALAGLPSSGGKEYCMYMRAAGQHLAYRLGAPVTPPVPPVISLPTFKSVKWSTKKPEQDRIMAEQRVLGYYPAKNLSGSFMEFEKVK